MAFSGSLAGKTVTVLSISNTGVTTNVSAVAYRKIQIYYAVTGGTLDNATNHFPYVTVSHLTTEGFTDYRVAYQNAAVYLGSYVRSGTTYDYTWRSDVWEQGSAGSAYYRVHVPEEGVEDYRNGYPLTGNSDRDYERGIAIVPAQDGTQWQYVMVDENKNVCPSNVLATAAQAARVEANVLLAQASMEAQTNAYNQAKAAIDQVADAIASQQVTIFQKDYVYSFGETTSVSTNAHCAIYRFDAKISTTTVGGVSYDVSDVYFGFTEDIGSLSPVSLLKSSLTSSLDWDEALADPMEPQTYSFERGGETYSYCYKMRLYIPHAWNAAFIKVFTEVTASSGDGSVINLIGGMSGGYNGTITVGSETLDVIGGLTMAPEGD